MLFGSIQTNGSSRPFETSSWISESDSGEIAGWWNIRDLISPPRTHSLPVKNGGRETILSFWDTLFSGAPVCFREGNIFHKLIAKWIKLSSECNFVEIQIGFQDLHWFFCFNCFPFFVQRISLWKKQKQPTSWIRCWCLEALDMWLDAIEIQPCLVDVDVFPTFHRKVFFSQNEEQWVKKKGSFWWGWTGWMKRRWNSPMVFGMDCLEVRLTSSRAW